MTSGFRIGNGLPPSLPPRTTVPSYILFGISSRECTFNLATMYSNGRRWWCGFFVPALFIWMIWPRGAPCRIHPASRVRNHNLPILTISWVCEHFLVASDTLDGSYFDTKDVAAAAWIISAADGSSWIQGGGCVCGTNTDLNSYRSGLGSLLGIYCSRLEGPVRHFWWKSIHTH